MADTYTTGTITVGAGGSPIVGSGTAWAAVAYRGDLLIHNASGAACFVGTVTDDTHIIPLGGAWPGGAVVAGAYTLYKNSPLRFANNSAMQVILDTWEMLQNTGVIYAVVGVGVLPDVGIGTNGQYAINLDDSPWKFYKKVAGVWVLQASLITSLNIREKLTANRTYFVRADGSNSNTGLVNSAGGAFLTLQKAYDTICANLDLAGFTVTIQVADGAYTAGIAFNKAWTGGGNINVTGNAATPANCPITVAGADVFPIIVPLPGVVAFSGFKTKTTGSGTIFNATAPCKIAIANFDVNGHAGNFVGAVTMAAPSAFAVLQSNITISGGGANAAFVEVILGGTIQFFAQTIAVTGAPNFGWRFAFAGDSGSNIYTGGAVFSGGATGTKYEVTRNAVINAGGNPNLFPGTISGSQSNGGLYV